jgi:hypothetical protein
MLRGQVDVYRGPSVSPDDVCCIEFFCWDGTRQRSQGLAWVAEDGRICGSHADWPRRWPVLPGPLCRPRALRLAALTMRAVTLNELGAESDNASGYGNNCPRASDALGAESASRPERETADVRGFCRELNGALSNPLQSGKGSLARLHRRVPELRDQEPPRL